MDIDAAPLSEKKSGDQTMIVFRFPAIMQILADKFHSIALHRALPDRQGIFSGIKFIFLYFIYR